MTIKCLAFDLDGTLLLDDSKRMDPRTVDSIQRAMAQGMHIVIASVEIKMDVNLYMNH